ncbi:DNA polymerase III [Paenibacillus macquariensis subsp. defensor]|nr:DNA polymerase III [Paenibacillus macquariensis subsp. defensor]
MDYVILDIEFNGRKFASDLPMEVIEIGAVRLDSQLRYVDEFSALIKPVYFSKLNSFIKKKTGIPQEDIDQAAGFRKVITDFMSWLNRSESFLLFTWGGEDLKRIIYDTRMHKMDDAFWMSANYFDLLKGFVRYKNITNDVSVEGALLDLNIAPSGSAHRALDDAKMTSEVFRAIFDKLDFAHTQQFVDVYSNAKERRLVKNSIRSMTLQKIPLTWENLFERFLLNKASLEDPRKLTELQEYFNVEINKVKKSVAGSAK